MMETVFLDFSMDPGAEGRHGLNSTSWQFFCEKFFQRVTDPLLSKIVDSVYKPAYAFR